MCCAKMTETGKSSLTIWSVFAFMLCALSGINSAFAIEVGAVTIDCEEFKASTRPDHPETEEERTARLMRDFDLSLLYFDRCIEQIELIASGGSTGGGGVAGSGGSAGGEAGSTGDGADGESGDAGAQGARQDPADADGGDGAGTGQASAAAQEPSTGTGQVPPDDLTTTGEFNGRNGGAPADIPNGRDDDIVASQIRQAAMESTDPVARKRLWDEYRKYKGIDNVDSHSF
jgi:hypothetical protein